MTTPILALHGGSKTITQPIAGWPQFGTKDQDFLVRALKDSQHCASQARAVGYTVRFEEEFARYHGRKFGVACSNCTQGLEGVLAIAGIGPGDEVLVPSYTFMATASSVIRAGAIPVFVDIDPDTMCTNARLLEAGRTQKTKAAIPVHFGGYLEDMRAIHDWAQAHGILILEDAAQAHGSCRDGYHAGAFSMGAVFSFQRNKNMCAGEGGIFVTDDEDLKTKFKEFIWHGMKIGGAEGHHSIASNLRITEFQSAILLAQLENLAGQDRRRMSACNALDAAIGMIEGFRPLKLAPLTSHARHLYMFKIDQEFWGSTPKKRIHEALIAEGVTCGTGYAYPLYRNPVFNNKNFTEFYRRANKPSFDAGLLDFRNTLLPNVEIACQEIMTIPHFVFLSDFDVAGKIAEALTKVAKNRKTLEQVPA
ncbi:MAG: DegT/DnrJ/EryC1/StrS family aminotransferase [Elusimicrobiota bacterium]|jgi:dTDP-4-amino-4,6-dideoxygalactose transaminase